MGIELNQVICKEPIGESPRQEAIENDVTADVNLAP